MMEAVPAAVAELVVRLGAGQAAEPEQAARAQVAGWAAPPEGQSHWARAVNQARPAALAGEVG